MATLVPLALFYTVMWAGSVTWAIGACVGYAWAMSGWQLYSRRRVSGMLLVTLITSTFRAGLAVVSGHTLLYFAIPIAETVVFGLAFVVTRAGSVPLVIRLARDLVPSAAEGLSGQGRLVRSLSMVWAGAYLGSAATTALLLVATPLPVFVGAHVAAGWAWNLAAVVMSVLKVRRQAPGVFAEVLAGRAEAPVPSSTVPARTAVVPGRARVPIPGLAAVAASPA